jgi:hypothetical protein
VQLQVVMCFRRKTMASGISFYMTLEARGRGLVVPRPGCRLQAQRCGFWGVGGTRAFYSITERLYAIHCHCFHSPCWPAQSFLGILRTQLLGLFACAPAAPFPQASMWHTQRLH